MLPTEVIAAAKRRQLSLLGLTDHNSAENVGAFVAASAGSGVRVLPGMEVTTREEVHVVTLFEDVEQALAWQEMVYRHLPPLANDERAFGTQLVVDAADRIVRVNERLLMTATDLTLGQVIEEVDRAGGLAIPAHVDRAAFGLLSQLGFVPDDLDIPAVEVSKHADPVDAVRLHQSLLGRAIIQSSDAHYVDDIGVGRTVFWLAEPTLAELKLACRGREGRRVAMRRPRG